MTTTHNGRAYELTSDKAELTNLRANLISRGFDGTVYYGVSKPTGRQRKECHSMFYRSVKTGDFVCAM